MHRVIQGTGLLILRVWFWSHPQLCQECLKPISEGNGGSVPFSQLLCAKCPTLSTEREGELMSHPHNVFL